MDPAGNCSGKYVLFEFPAGESEYFYIGLYLCGSYFLMIVLMNRHIIRPILSLTRAMDRFAEGELQISEAETYKTREINSLFIHFNSMTKRYMN